MDNWCILRCMMQIKNKKLLFITTGIVLVLLCVGIAWWWQQSSGGAPKSGDNQPPVSGQSVYDAQLGFSVVIPDSWQGKYQMNSGSQAVAFNFANGTSSYPLFTVYAYPEKDWAVVQKSTSLIVSIASHNGTVFAYNVTPSGLFKGAAGQQQQFETMLKDVPAIVQSMQFTGSGK